MIKLIGFLAMIALGLGAVRLYQWRSASLASPREGQSLSDRQRITAYLDQRPLTLEIVSAPASIQQGLSGREQIGADGMLFILGPPQPSTFWMKDMRFDLDLIWLRDFRVIEITPQVPHPVPGQDFSQLPTYSPNALVDMVLEVPAGKSAEWNLKPGATLRLSSPN